MSKRQRATISPKTRFEVFKRDSFRCQYCGAAAPEVLLTLDHIKPVAEGGPDDIMNLVTACGSCNSGKGARTLDDGSAVERQRRQLEELEERRQQLEMMLQWRQGLQGIEEMAAVAVVNRLHELAPGWTPTESGLASIRKWLRDFSLNEVLDAAERSAVQYLEWTDEDTVTQGSWQEFFSKIPRIVSVTRAAVTEPHLPDLFYVRGILRRTCNWHWRAQRDCMTLLKGAVAAGIAIEDLKGLAKNVTSFGEFEETVNQWMNRPEKE